MPNVPRLSQRRPALAAEPDLPPAYKAAIYAAVRWAWEQVLAQWPDRVLSGSEEQITECMARVLNEQSPDARRTAPGLDSFETVVRGGKVSTADGRIEKQPDLVFRPVVAVGVRNRGDWGLFVECKIIGLENHHSPEAYCVNGVARFVRGEYAARMPCAAMLAFVRDRRLPHPTLSVLLDTTYATTSHEAGATNDTSLSRHARKSLPHPCVNISLVHWWLDGAPRA